MNRSIVFFVSFLSVFIFGAGLCSAQTIIPVGPPPASIQAAIDSAAPGDTVLVEPGIYTGPNNTNLSFGGKAITVKSRTGAATTIIDCGGTDRGFIFALAETRASVLKGFTIRNGNGAIDGLGGGAILMNGASPKIIKCIFRKNISGLPASDINGGAIRAITLSSPLIRNCTFIKNTAARDGGAISISTGSPVIQQCLFFRNKAGVIGDITIGSGAGIDLSDTNALISSCTVTLNNAAKEAGGLKMSGTGTTSVVNSIIQGNTSGNPLFPEIQAEPPGVGGPVLAAKFSNLNITPLPGRRNINANPAFAAPTLNNFTLTPASPSRNVGTNVPVGGLLPTDLAGNPRLFGARVDMGAFELQQ